LIFSLEINHITVSELGTHRASVLGTFSILLPCHVHCHMHYSMQSKSIQTCEELLCWTIPRYLTVLIWHDFYYTDIVEACYDISLVPILKTFHAR